MTLSAVRRTRIARSAALGLGSAIRQAGSNPRASGSTPARGRRFRDPLYRFPLAGFLRWPIGAVALGIAQAAIDEIPQTSRGKTPRGSATTLREQPLFQSQLSQAVALVRSARSWLHEIVTSVWEKTAGGDTASFDNRALFNLAGVNATRSALSAVELAYAAGGGSANYRTNPLQRHVRGYPRRDAAYRNGSQAV